jgi:CheY-like chemotaxis protein
VPILVVTAETRSVQLDRVQNAGADAVLIKPSTPDVIFDETQRLLMHSRDVDGRSGGT